MRYINNAEHEHMNIRPPIITRHLLRHWMQIAIHELFKLTRWLLKSCYINALTLSLNFELQHRQLTNRDACDFQLTMQVYLSALVFFWIAAKQLEEIVACENVRFQESEQKYLPNHVMKTKQADSYLVCGLYCIADNSCTSVNYKTSGIGKGRCELNNKTTEDTSDVDETIHHPEFNHLVVIERVSIDLNAFMNIISGVAISLPWAVLISGIV